MLMVPPRQRALEDGNSLLVVSAEMSAGSGDIYGAISAATPGSPEIFLRAMAVAARLLTHSRLPPAGRAFIGCTL